MKVGFIGGGSWGATLANLLTDNGHEVLVYDVNKDTVALINESHKHPFFDATLNVEVKATTSIDEVLSFSNTLVLSVPTKFMRSVLEQVNNLSTEPKFFINVSKGIEPETSKTISQIAEEVMDSNKLKGFVTLSGPSHAEEVIERKLTVLVSASKNEADAVYVQNLDI